MGLLDGLLDALKSASGSSSNIGANGFIATGGNKVDGGHDHRTNKGEDRTPAQKSGDKKRTNE